MARDRLYGERIIWVGRPKQVTTPTLFKIAGGLFALLSAISLSYAVTLALALKLAPTAAMLFSAWCASLGLACFRLPPLWLAKVRYVVTENRVIWRRGPFHRSIERKSISFARVFWSKKFPGTGDLELVRAVPTGALRRRLALRLNSLSAPDRVWAIVRGAESIAPAGHGDRPLAQRLDRGERVLWSARPRPSGKAYLPHSQREWAMLVIALLLLGSVAHVIWRAVPALDKVLRAGLPGSALAFGALTFGLSATVLILLAVCGALIYSASLRPGRLVSHTRYLVTDTRVLIQRASEELHLDRAKIVEVIDAPLGNGLSDVFIVLDGPRARALAASGAFGELQRGPYLRPVFEAVEDVEGLSRILGNKPELPKAA